MPGQVLVLQEGTRHQPSEVLSLGSAHLPPGAGLPRETPQGRGRGPSRVLHFPPLKTGVHSKTELESPVLQKQVTSAGASGFEKPGGGALVFPEDSPMSRCLGFAS